MITDRLDFFSIPVLFDEEQLENEREPVKVGAPYDESSVMIAVIVTDAGQRVLLTNSEEDPNNDPVWYVPSGDIDNGECLITAAKRHFHAETDLELINVRIASVENYPSLRRNFTRFIAIGEPAPGSSSAVCGNGRKWDWFSIPDLRSDSVQLLSFDIESIIKTVVSEEVISASFRPMIPADARHYLSVQVGLVIGTQVLIVRKSCKHPWRLPSTYVDYRSGESVPFAAQRYLGYSCRGIRSNPRFHRVMGRFLKVIPDIIGAVHVQHGYYDLESKPVQRGCLGSCITVLAHSKLSIEQVESIFRDSLDDELWRFLNMDEANIFAADEECLQVIERLIAGASIPMKSV